MLFPSALSLQLFATNVERDQWDTESGANPGVSSKLQALACEVLLQRTGVGSPAMSPNGRVHVSLLPWENIWTHISTYVPSRMIYHYSLHPTYI